MIRHHGRRRRAVPQGELRLSAPLPHARSLPRVPTPSAQAPSPPFDPRRMFKLIRNARGLRTLFNTLINSMPAILNVGSLLFLLMFIYAVLGMNLMGGHGNPFEDSPDTNFNNFATSLVALFQAR
ncbi:Sodium channel protein type 11 subunit alpha [Tetrabaena socialis]|uniref:Sodium channel protein type 11 subunit alpha n=1 Tax=Tetrabaena socialis TaxID=47790 RepID=A0A2J8A2W3_9CHLO|nr:Sodium channel protein type 11 subunit alpha [Tetrabaena socialis]|eukprot:PNH06856.1 Sodium channel protein type 11 subunit alpha [Tetrabaena socialis]